MLQKIKDRQKKYFSSLTFYLKKLPSTQTMELPFSEIRTHPIMKVMFGFKFSIFF